MRPPARMERPRVQYGSTLKGIPRENTDDFFLYFHRIHTLYCCCYYILFLIISENKKYILPFIFCSEIYFTGGCLPHNLFYVRWFHPPLTGRFDGVFCFVTRSSTLSHTILWGHPCQQKTTRTVFVQITMRKMQKITK